MSDMKPGPLDYRQRGVDRHEALQTHLDGRQSQIHTSMPGRIVSFNPATMTATVQPAIQGIHTQLDGTRVPTDIEAIRDVPVHFPAGGGYTMTFPVAAGDECLIVFAERSIDNWHQNGGNQQPSDWRMHDINDAVAHVGLRSQPNVLKSFHGSNVQMRSDDGTRFVEINAMGIRLVAGNTVFEVLSSGVINITASGGVNFSAPGGVNITTPLIAVTGDVTAGAISLQHHTHSDPQGGNVGPPV